MSAGTILLIVISQIALVANQILLKNALNLMAAKPGRPWIVALFFSFSIGSLVLWYLLWIGFLQTMPISQVLPWEGLSPVLLVGGAAWFLGEKIPPSAWLGILLISAGIVMVSFS